MRRSCDDAIPNTRKCQCKVPRGYQIFVSKVFPCAETMQSFQMSMPASECTRAKRRKGKKIRKIEEKLKMKKWDVQEAINATKVSEP